MSTSPHHPSNTQVTGPAARYLGLGRALRCLPLPAALALGRGLGRLAPRLSPKHARRICADATRAFGPDFTAQQAAELARACYENLGQSLVEFLRTPFESADALRRRTRLEGTAPLDDALARGHGAIVLTAHLGNWEICGTAIALHGYPLTAIARAQGDPTVTTLLNRIRETHALKVILMEDVRAALRVLKGNGCLGIVGDVNANTPGAFVNFLGAPAATFTGAAYFAQATGAPIVPCFDTRQPDGTHVIRFGEPVAVSHTGDRQRDLLITTMRCQYVIQQEIRRRPGDWFWLIQRWKTRPEQVPTPERIPMEHRDLTPEESAEILAHATERGS